MYRLQLKDKHRIPQRFQELFSAQAPLPGGPGGRLVGSLLRCLGSARAAGPRRRKLRGAAAGAAGGDGALGIQRGCRGGSVKDQGKSREEMGSSTFCENLTGVETVEFGCFVQVFGMNLDEFRVCFCCKEDHCNDAPCRNLSWLLDHYDIQISYPIN